jgi:4-amino-4-deoxy-L-arabinose transferase-like glycosyltransferase
LSLPRLSFPEFATNGPPRLPSALFILAVALTLATVGRISLGPIGSFIAALCWLTNLRLIGKGRMVEIEAIYCSLFAFALILWLLLWEQKRFF